MTNTETPASDDPLCVIDWSGKTNRIEPQVLEQFWQNLAISAGPFTEADRQSLSDYIESTDRLPPPRPQHMAMRQVMQEIETLAASGALTPVAALKMVRFFEVRREAVPNVPANLQAVFEVLHETTGRPTLLEVAAMLHETGSSDRAPLLSWCSRFDAVGRNWSEDHLRPYFAQHADELRQMIANRKGFMLTQRLSAPDEHLVMLTGTNRPAVYRAAAMIAGQHSAVADALFEVALGTVASERPYAQDALRGIDGIKPRIIEATLAKNAKTRTAATEWLTRIGLNSAASAPAA